MKKVLTVLVLSTLICCSVFAVTAGSTSGNLVYEEGGAGNTTNDSATLTYSLTTKENEENPDEPVVSTYKIGFSSNAITSLSDTPTNVETVTLTVGDDFTASIPETSPIHIYWQIASPVNCTISLTPSSMTGSSNNKLHVHLSTTIDNSSARATAYAVSNTGVTENDNSSDEKSAENLKKTVLTYTAGTTTTNNQIAGSQTISIVTNNIAGLDSDTYSGTLTLTINATN